MAHIKIGYAPTRRSIFSAPDAVKYSGPDCQNVWKSSASNLWILRTSTKKVFCTMTKTVDKIAEKFKAEKMWMDCSCRTATSEQSMSARDLQKNWMCRFFCGGHWMRDRSQTVCVCATPSADCLQPEKCCSRFQIPFTYHDKLPFKRSGL